MSVSLFHSKMKSAGEIAGNISSIFSDTYCFKWIFSNSRVFKYCDKLKSPTFTTGVNKKHKWHLEFNNTCHLYIHINECQDEDVYVSVKISSPIEEEVMGINGTLLHLGKSYVSEELHKFSSLFKTFSKGHIDWSRLPFNEVTIFCDITYEPKEILKFNDHRLFSDLRLILENGEHSDMTIAAGKERFHVHKFMIMLRCPVLVQMFADDVTENNRKVVQVTDIDEHVMEKLLEYIYTGTVKNINVSTEKLLIAAYNYSLEELKCMCSKVLIGRISKNNVHDMMRLADKYSADDLKQGILDYVSMSGEEVIRVLESLPEMDLPIFSLKQIFAKF